MGQEDGPESSGVAARPLRGEGGAPGRTHNSFQGNRGEEAEGVPVMGVGRGLPEFTLVQGRSTWGHISC